MDKKESVKKKIIGLCDKWGLEYPARSYSYVKEVCDKINELEEKAHVCPSCGKHIGSYSVICSCEINRSYDVDYIDWLNKE